MRLWPSFTTAGVFDEKGHPRASDSATLIDLSDLGVLPVFEAAGPARCIC